MATANKRLASLDLLRGFDLFCLLMFQPILITWLEIENSPALAPITNQFTHVEWQGVAFWDLIMPLFMFMSGITIPFAMSRYKQGDIVDHHFYLRLLKRFFILFLLGWVVQGNLLALDIRQFHIFANTLQAIAVGYVVAALLKILDVPLYILPGIICLALFPQLENPDEAYMTMVTHLFPVGMVGLVLAVLTAALVSTIGSALNALSTVFTMDIYVKKIRPQAKQKEIIRVGQVVTVAGALISVIITIAIDSIHGLNLFNVFQSVLGFIAPPMAAVFLFGVFWKRTTTLAANAALTVGTVFSIGVGVLYLWVFPADQYSAWPHFMLLSFYLFVIIGIGMVVVGLLDKTPQTAILNMEKIEEKPARIVLILWGLLIVTMIGLYIFFNGH